MLRIYNLNVKISKYKFNNKLLDDVILLTHLSLSNMFFFFMISFLRGLDLILIDNEKNVSIQLTH